MSRSTPESPGVDALVEANSFAGGRSAQLLGLAFDAAPIGLLIVDGEGCIVSMNARIGALFGCERSELAGQSLEALASAESRAAVRKARKRLSPQADAHSSSADGELFGLRKDGVEFPIELGLKRLAAPDDEFLLISIVDITRRKRFEATLRDQLRERDVLLQEIHHRVKNNMQVISSLISLQLGRMEQGPGYNALQECSLRVLAIAHIHEQLYLSKDFSRVPFSEYAQNLAVVMFRATGACARRIDLKFALEPVSVAVDAAIPCGLILSELLSNALRHGFSGTREGAVTVEMRAIEGQRLLLAVSDDGVGVPEGFDPARCGSLGMQLIQTLAGQVEGAFTLESSASGARFQLIFPAAR